MKPVISAVILLFFSFHISLSQVDCKCERFSPIGTNLSSDPVVLINKKPLSLIQGNVSTVSGFIPSKTYVFVYRMPDTTPNDISILEEFTMENIVAACEIGNDGKFCFNDFSRGSYAVCASTPSNSDFASRTICKVTKLEPEKQNKKRRLEIILEPAT
jgi:hypothetical protein